MRGAGLSFSVKKAKIEIRSKEEGHNSKEEKASKQKTSKKRVKPTG